MIDEVTAVRRRRSDGHDLDHYADDLKAVTDHLNLKDPIHVGHSTGGGEVVRYLARHGDKNVAKAAIISAVPPLMVKTPANPLGLPKSVFDDLQAQLSANRAKFYYDLPAGPFYGFNRPGVKTIEPIVWNWWRQGMMGGAKAGYDGIVAFSQTDFTEDLKKISVPVLVMHSKDDQIVPYQAAGPLSAKLLKNGTLKTYEDYPHGMTDDSSRRHQCRPSGVHPILTTMSTSIRNRLPGTIEKIVSDNVVSEVVIRTAAGIVTSIITTGSARRMNLKEGDNVFAVMKATSVSVEKG